MAAEEPQPPLLGGHDGARRVLESEVASGEPSPCRPPDHLSPLVSRALNTARRQRALVTPCARLSVALSDRGLCRVVRAGAEALLVSVFRGHRQARWLLAPGSRWSRELAFQHHGERQCRRAAAGRGWAQTRLPSAASPRPALGLSQPPREQALGPALWARGLRACRSSVFSGRTERLRAPRRLLAAGRASQREPLRSAAWGVGSGPGSAARAPPAQAEEQPCHGVRLFLLCVGWAAWINQLAQPCLPLATGSCLS